jgi:hypothetical protein
MLTTEKAEPELITAGPTGSSVTRFAPASCWPRLGISRATKIYRLTAFGVALGYSSKRDR